MATAVVYVRKIDGREVFFGHAGKLYHNSFVMYEKKTDSEFLGVSGIGAVGKYRGILLQQYPSVLTTWGEWKKHYPKGNKVMQRRSTGGMMGTYRGASRANGLVLALDVNGKTKGYDMQSLRSKGFVEDEFNGTKIVWLATSTGTTLVRGRTIAGKALTFQKGSPSNGRETITDKETKSIWLVISGECVEGKMKGKFLPLLPTTPFEQKDWANHHKSASIDR